MDQPEWRLARAVLAFDPPLGSAFLTTERKSLEENGPSLLYETTAWSPAIAYGVDAYATTGNVPVSGEFMKPDEASPEGSVAQEGATYGFVADALDEAMPAALAALHRAGITSRVATEPFSAGGRAFGTGSIVLRREENGPALLSTVQEVARRTGVHFQGVDHARSDAGPDLGSRRFRVLERPRVALLSGRPLYPTTFGALWHFLDQELGLAVSIFNLGSLTTTDLSPYNVIILGDANEGAGPALVEAIGPIGREALRLWVSRGEPSSRWRGLLGSLRPGSPDRQHPRTAPGPGSHRRLPAAVAPPIGPGLRRGG